MSECAGVSTCEQGNRIRLDCGAVRCDCGALRCNAMRCVAVCAGEGGEISVASVSAGSTGLWRGVAWPWPCPLHWATLMTSNKV